MSDPTWPVSLPVPSLEGYSVTDKLPLIRTEMEGGASRVTRISTSYVSNISFSMVLDNEQATSFREFFEYSANAGANWVEIPLNTGQGVATHRARFMSVGFSVVSDKLVKVACSVEVDARVSNLG